MARMGVVDGGGTGVGIAWLEEGDVVFVFQFHTAGAGNQTHANLEQVVVADGTTVIHKQLGDDQEGTLNLHRGVGQTSGTEELGSGHFQPRCVIGVVGDPHRIALAIPDTEGGRPREHRAPLGDFGE